MAKDLLSFQCAIITGGGGGIGNAMAKWLLSLGKKVIIVGRTESKLIEASKDLGAGSKNVPHYVLDTGKVDTIPDFVSRVTKDHPEVDCLINNAGVQRPLNVDSFDLAKADQEIDINIRGPMHLAITLLPHLKSKAHPVIVNVSSVLGFIPFSIINPVYNGSKAWIHFWSMNLRTQLKQTNVAIIEIAPPTVSTDLHRERDDPDDNKKDKNPNALDIDEFIQDMAQQWRDGKETIGVGMGEGIVQRWSKEFGPEYNKAADAWGT